MCVVFWMISWNTYENIGWKKDYTVRSLCQSVLFSAQIALLTKLSVIHKHQELYTTRLRAFDMYASAFSSWPWPLTFSPQNLISSSLSPMALTFYIWWNSAKPLVRYCVYNFSQSPADGRTDGQSVNILPPAPLWQQQQRHKSAQLSEHRTPRV